MNHSFLITCEHADNRVPPQYRGLFKGHSKLLNSHRGYDPGALKVAQCLANILECRLIIHRATRLLADVNRSRHNPSVFSEVTRSLTRNEKENILTKWHAPHREKVAEAVRGEIETARVIHLAVHSFTPVLNGKPRALDCGLLYDPSRKPEASFCGNLKKALAIEKPDWRIRMNRPYLGVSDGLTRYLRQQFPSSRYIGVELEFNQLLIADTTSQKRAAEKLGAVLHR